MYECEKCKKELGWSMLMRLKMRGPIFAHLCPGCETKYAELIMANEHFQRQVYLQAVEASIVRARELSQDNADPALMEVHQELFKCSEVLRTVGLEWLGREG